MSRVGERDSDILDVIKAEVDAEFSGRVVCVPSPPAERIGAATHAHVSRRGVLIQRVGRHPREMIALTS